MFTAGLIWFWFERNILHYCRRPQSFEITYMDLVKSITFSMNFYVSKIFNYQKRIFYLLCFFLNSKLLMQMEFWPQKYFKKLLVLSNTVIHMISNSQVNVHQEVSVLYWVFHITLLIKNTQYFYIILITVYWHNVILINKWNFSKNENHNWYGNN